MKRASWRKRRDARQERSRFFKLAVLVVASSVVLELVTVALVVVLLVVALAVVYRVFLEMSLEENFQGKEAQEGPVVPKEAA